MNSTAYSGARISAIVATAFRAAGTSKEVARLVSASPRTVERWQRGEAEPPASAMLALLRRSQGAARLIMEHLSTEYLDAEERRLNAELARLRRSRPHAAPPTSPDRPETRAGAAEASAAAFLILAERLR